MFFGKFFLVLKYLYYSATELFPLRSVNLFKKEKNRNSVLQYRQDEIVLLQLEIKIFCPYTSELIKILYSFRGFEIQCFSSGEVIIKYKWKIIPFCFQCSVVCTHFPGFSGQSSG